MTWLAWWQPSGSPFPAYTRHETEEAAEAAAGRVSAELGGVEVAVVREEDIA